MISPTSTREIDAPLLPLLQAAAILLAAFGGLVLAVAVSALDGPDEVSH